MSQPQHGPWYREIERHQWRTLLGAMGGWMLDSLDFVIYLMAIPTLAAEFGFGTEMAGWLATVALLTSAIGGMVAGFLADRFGRRRTLMATILCFSLCSLGTATAQSLTQLMIWRALLGLGMGGEWAAGATLVSETWPAAHRGKAIGIMQSGWALGYIAAALLAAAVLPHLGWRWLFAFGILPALSLLWIRREVGESPLWQEDHSKNQSAFLPLRRLLTPPLLGRTALASSLAGLVMFAYWGLFTWVPSFLAMPLSAGGAGLGLVKSMGWLVPMQIGAFFGYITFGMLSDRFGRKPCVVFFLAAAATIVPVYGLMARSPMVLMALGPLLGFFGHGFFSLFGALLAELFPTSLRATAQGFCYNSGRALSALAPATIGALAAKQGIGPALLLTSAFFLGASMLVFLLPETKGMELSGTLGAARQTTS